MERANFQVVSYHLGEDLYAVVIEGVFANDKIKEPQTLQLQDMPWRWTWKVQEGIRRVYPAGMETTKREDIYTRYTKALCGCNLLVQQLSESKTTLLNVNDKDGVSNSATAAIAGIVQRGGSLAHWLNLMFWVRMLPGGNSKSLPKSLDSYFVEAPTPSDFIDHVCGGGEVEPFVRLEGSIQRYDAALRPWRTSILTEAGSCCSALDLIYRVVSEKAVALTPEHVLRAIWLHSHPGSSDGYWVPLLERSRGTTLMGPLYTFLRALSLTNESGTRADLNAEFSKLCSVLPKELFLNPDPKEANCWNDEKWQKAFCETLDDKSRIGYPIIQYTISKAGGQNEGDFFRKLIQIGLNYDSLAFVKELRQLLCSNDVLMDVLTRYWVIRINALVNNYPALEILKNINSEALVDKDKDKDVECARLHAISSKLVSALGGADPQGAAFFEEPSLARCYQDCLAGCPTILPSWGEKTGELPDRIRSAVRGVGNILELTLDESIVCQIADPHWRRINGSMLSETTLPSSPSPVPIVLNLPKLDEEKLQMKGWTKLGILARRMELGYHGSQWCNLSVASLYDDDSMCRLVESELVGRQTGGLKIGYSDDNSLSCLQEFYLQQSLFGDSYEVILSHGNDESIGLPRTRYRYDGTSPLPCIKYRKKFSYQFAYFPIHISGALPIALRNADIPSAIKDDWPKPVDGDIQSIENYLRRVPVGRCTLEMSANDQAWQTPDKISSSPRRVRLLAEDLGLNRISGDDTRRLPTYLLCPTDSKSAWRSKLKLRIYPPKTGFLNWRFWVQSEDSVLCHDLIDLLAIRDRDARQKAVENSRLAEDKDSSFQILDPAVYGIACVVVTLFPERSKYLEESNLRIHPLPVDWQTEVDHSLAANRLQAPKPIMNWELGCENSGKGTINLSANEIVTDLAAGSIYKISICPTVRVDQWEQRFGLDKPSKVFGDPPVYILEDASTEFLIETTPCNLELPKPALIWQALCKGTACFGNVPSTRYPIQLQIERASMVDNLPWIWVAEGTLRFQTWRWAGLPEDGVALLKGATQEPTAEVPDLDEGASWLKAEAASYAERSDDDALLKDFSVNVAKEVKESGDLTIFIDQHQTDELPRHHRMAVELRHRYQAVYPDNPCAQAGSMLDSFSGQICWPQDTIWLRRIARGGIEKLLPPAIHMIVPLVDPEPGETRPGFVVFLREGLPSPFHSLYARVEGEEYGGKSIPAIGTWPVQEKKGYEGCWPTEWNGRITGLTYEGEKIAPSFPHLAVAFRCPTAEFPDSDLYLRVSFAWQLTPGVNATECTPSWSVPWGIWLLSGFRVFNGYDLTAMNFRITKSGPEFKIGGNSVDLCRLVPESYINVSNDASGSKAGMELGLLFVCWRNSPLGIGAGLARRTVGFYLLSRDGRHVPLLSDSDHSESADAGQFLLVQARPKNWRCDAGEFDWIEKTFFGERPPPEAPHKNRGDAQAVIARISEAIPFQP